MPTKAEPGVSLGELRRSLAAQIPSPDEAQFEADLILSTVLDCSLTDILVDQERPVPPQCIAAMEGILIRRRRGEPLAYILGVSGFWDMLLRVRPGALIPRIDTETLIELVLDLIPNQPAVVADLGTGSGAIALALARERPDWIMIAMDISTQALEVAAVNRREQGLQDRVHLAQADWASALARKCLDLIVANPPYVAMGDVHLESPDIRYEPIEALVSGVDGCQDLRRIIRDAPRHLKDGGWLALEHGHNQGARVVSMLAKRGFRKIRIRRDTAGIVRASAGLWLETEDDPPALPGTTPLIEGGQGKRGSNEG